MIAKSDLLAVLPPFKNEWVLVEDRQDTTDIRKTLLQVHGECCADYDRIYHFFNTGNVVDTSRSIFEFLKSNVPYTKESDKRQTCKNPAGILTDGSTVDCKNYSLFIGGILDAIQRADAVSWDWAYRFASYDENDPEPGHVFVVVRIDGKELWVDPVFTYFNSGTMHAWELDEKPGKSIAGLYKVSGPPDMAAPAPVAGVVTVNAQQAADNFLVAVNLDLFSLKELLNSDETKLYGPVRDLCLANGVNFNSLVNLLRYG